MNDSEIVSLFLSRDSEAINHAEKKYGGICFTIAGNILNDKRDAQEVKNDTFLALWNSIPPNKPQKLSAFVSRIARNLSLKRLRDNNAGKRGGGEFDLAIDELSEMIPDGFDVEGRVEADELKGLINHFVASLDEDEQKMFVLRYFYFFSVDDTAKRTGYSKSKIKSSLFRIRKRLKEKLEREGHI